MTGKPIIGVIDNIKQIEGESAYSVKTRYVDGIAKFADAIPLIIPSTGVMEDYAGVVSAIDALMLTGATSNIEAHHFGSSAEHAPAEPTRDNAAFGLLEAAKAAEMPVFGICRGLQEINVALGGSIADQRDRDFIELNHHSADGASLEDMFAHKHEIDVAPGSLLEQMTGERRMTVNSVHYQMIDRLGEGLRVEATAPDGCIEAVSSREGRSIFAVQWHPEWRPEETAHYRALWHYVGEMARQRGRI